MKWEYCCTRIITFHWLGQRFKMVVRFKMFYILWLQYFYDNDTWQANVLLYSASAAEALFSPFRFSNFMTLWKERDHFLNILLSKKKQSEKCRNASLLYFRTEYPFCSGAQLSVEHLWASAGGSSPYFFDELKEQWNQTGFACTVGQIRHVFWPTIYFV